MSIESNINGVSETIIRAAEKTGRSPNEVRLIAVTKLHESDEINEAIAAGITDIGENKVQEIIRKYDDIDPVRWHLIGHLQRNKVKQIIDKVEMIHSVDSMRLAEEIEKRAKINGSIMDILIQVNTAREEQKYGINPEELDLMIDKISKSCDYIRIRGLMCIAPYFEDTEMTRPYFREAYRLYKKYEGRTDLKGVDFQYLSMGMSGDFDIAIEEGSNMVRVGTAIFGKRDYRSEER